MKATNLVLAAVLVPLIVAISGCRMDTIRNIEQAPIATSSNSTSLENVTKAIQVAGSGLGWAMRKVKPGHIEGTLFLRTHMAKVDVTYTTKTYSIKYKDSSDLGYDGENIHKNYNGWIINLSNAINQQLSIL